MPVVETLASARTSQAGAAPFSQREAISEYLDVNETQVSGIKDAIASLDRRESRLG